MLHVRQQTFFTADIFKLQGKRSMGVMNNINDECIQSKWTSFRALLSCMLCHWNDLFNQIVKLETEIKLVFFIRNTGISLLMIKDNNDPTASPCFALTKLVTLLHFFKPFL